MSVEILKPPAPGVQVVKLSIQEYRVLIEATATRPLDEPERGHLQVLLESFAAQQLAMKADYQGESEELQNYQKMLFGGPRSEKTSVVLGKGQDNKTSEKEGERPADTPSTAAPAADAPKKKPRKKVDKGHGRHGVAAYTGAKREKVPLTTLKTGDPCPNPQEDCEGSMYRYFEPRSVLRLEGVAPLSAVIYELEQFRCHDCGFLVCAPLPAGAGPEKYKATAVANLAMMRYCVCVPGSRLAMLQDGYGVPLASSTQWDVIQRNTPVARAVHEAMMTEAAQAPFFFNDDTGARILEVSREERAKILGPGADPKRTGIHTTGILAKCEEREIALYFTGPLYAAENLERLLERRAPELPPPVLMCDGLIHRNLPKGLEILLSQCNVHSRRNFVKLAGSFPDEAAFVIKTLAAVYAVDEAAKEHNLSDEGRLMLHQNESRRHMEALKVWMDEQIEDKLVEPNSRLGRAIVYTQKRWTELCLFLEVPGASLDNNVAEQLLRRIAHYRNGSLYYRTIEGAKVGDCWMSVIRTAEKAGVNVFDYLVAILEHESEVMANAKAWLPWTYLETLAQLEAAAAEKLARAAEAAASEELARAA